MGLSPMVQWLRLYTSSAESANSIPGWGPKIPYTMMHGPQSKHLLISWLQSPSAVILEPRKIKSYTVSTVSPSIPHEVMGPDTMILVFRMLSFNITFSLSSLTFIKRLISSSSLSAIRVVSSAYPRLLIFLPISPDNLDFSLCFIQPGISPDTLWI